VSERSGWVRLARVVITVGLPPFLLLSGVWLVMTETFLRLEYTRPGFPADPYGFSTEDRLHYGPYGVRYLRNDAGIAYLAALEQDGAPIFRQKELAHMQDVKRLTRAAWRVYLALSAVLLGALWALAHRPQTRAALRGALRDGAALTFGLVLSVVMASVMAWDMFFEAFHRVFFAGDSWLFYTSDTLIRLYPEQFWFDTALFIGGFALVGAGLLGVGMWAWERRTGW